MKRIYLFFILFFTVGCFSTTYAQSLEQYLTAADTSFKNKDYYSALNYYGIANEIQEYQDAAVWYKYAESARLTHAYTKADTAYQAVLDLSSIEKYPLSLYWLADVKQYLGKYQQAKALYERFVTESPLANGYYLQVAENAIDESDWAIGMMENPKDVEVQHLSGAVNTGYSEFAPYQMGDTLLYSSLSFYDEGDEYNPSRAYSKMMQSIDGNIGQPQTDGFNAQLQHSAHHAFNSAGDRIYYTICNYVDNSAEIRCRIYTRQKEGADSWGVATPLPDYINLNGYTTTHPNLGKNRETGQEYFFFTSDRPGGQGGYDIWCSYVNADGSIDEPINLPTLNTVQNEISPFFHTRTGMFYFSSEGHRGLGGYDIFKSSSTGDQFDAPENIGAPINGSYNDIYFTLDKKGGKAHFASNRASGTFLETESEICCNDIYAVEMDMIIDLVAFTFDGSTKEPLNGAQVELFEIDENGNQSIITKIQDYSNEFLFPLERGKKYLIVGSRDGYANATAEIDLTDGNIGVDVEKIEKELYLNPIEVNLLATTFDFDTEEPLFNATVSLFEMTASEELLIEKQVNEDGNDFGFPLELGKNYVIKTERKGYETRLDTIPIAEMEFTESKTVEVEIYLQRTNFDDFLPLLIYFDNDIPKRGASSTTASTEYTETVIPYLERQSDYKEEYTGEMEGDTKFGQAERFDIFFDREVKLGYETLLEFTEKLYYFVRRGNSVNIAFGGYTSPRASTEYNDKLSRRRIDSVIKYFRNYNNGIYNQYLDGGQLTITEEAFGETKAPQNVKDELGGEKDSIYSILASLERRVEIVGVSVERSKDEANIIINQRALDERGK
ncbi:MAG: hypothetical protein AB8G22_05700 [Saprospiraceae bacterium]